NELIRHASERLRSLTRQMLHGSYRRVRDVQETDDVLQSALVRLHRALQDPGVRPASLADFFRLATLQLRREPMALARHHFGPGRPRLVSPGPTPSAPSASPPVEAADATHNPERLLDWGEFHTAVAALPDEDREVFDLLWYQELTQAEAAAVLAV